MIEAARSRAIFVATIDKVRSSSSTVTENRDGSVSLSMTSLNSMPTELTIQETLQGLFSGRITFVSGYHFRVKERYLIYGDVVAGNLVVGACARVLSAMDAAEDLRYWYSLQTGAPFGVVIGQVTRELTDGTFEASRDRFAVVARSAGAQHQVSARSYGDFQLAIPAGSYFIWVEHEGRQLTNPKLAEVSSGVELHLHFQLPHQ